MQEPSLDLIGISEGTDKHSLLHDYLRHYERMFDRFRAAEIDLIEIGVANGASLRTWRRFFSKARIIGIDVVQACQVFADEANHVIVEIGSQDDPGFLLNICRRYQPSIIIDDGSHIASHIQFTFETLFPALQPGGCYVIEDIMFHFGSDAPQHIGTASRSLPDYLGQLVLGLLGNPHPENSDGQQRYFKDWIDRIEIIGRAVAIWKKPKLALVKSEINPIERALEQAGANGAWEWYAVKLSRAGLSVEAEGAALRAVALRPDNWVAHARLAELLEQRGDLHGARQAVERSMAVAIHPEEVELMRGRQEALKQRGAI